MTRTTELSSRTVTVDESSLHYLTGGGGRPLVLLHGGIIDAAHISWGPLLSPLADRARVYAVDLPGYGRSELPDGPMPVGRHVDRVAELLATLELSDPVVAGVSLGGGVATGLAVEYPDRVGHIVPIDAFALGNDLPNGLVTWALARLQILNVVSVALTARSRTVAAGSVGALAHDPDSVPDETIQQVQTEAARPGAGAAFRALRAAEVTRAGYRTNYTDRLTDLTVPARFVHGAEDDLIPPAWSRRAADRADAPLRLVPDCGHLPTLEAPDTVLDVIEEVV